MATSTAHSEAPLTARRFGRLIPNRIFVSGISGETTGSELCYVFSAYGNVQSARIILDRAGVCKGYGFVTFKTDEEARRCLTGMKLIVLRDRKLRIAPAMKCTRTPRNIAVNFAPTPNPNFNVAAPQDIAVNHASSTIAYNAVPAQYTEVVQPPPVLSLPTLIPYQPVYQCVMVPMNVPVLNPYSK